MHTYAQKPQHSQTRKVIDRTQPSTVRSPQGHHILQSQRTSGNQAVQRLLQGNAEELKGDSTTTGSIRFGHDFSRIPLHAETHSQLQPKLSISNPGDLYEQEADRVSDQVMRMPKSQLQRAFVCRGGCSKCRKEQGGHELVQTKRVQAIDAGLTTVPPIVREVTSSPGRLLDPTTRGFMQSRFAHDFSKVRIHTDRSAAISAATVGSRAFTAGHHIVFGASEFAPQTTQGRKLLAHELTHVLQQTGHGAREASKSRRGRGLIQRQASATFTEDDLVAYLERLDTTGTIQGGPPG